MACYILSKCVTKPGVEQVRDPGRGRVALRRPGFPGTSLQDIASVAGVSRGMPNYVFGSKSELYRLVVERALTIPQAFAERLAAALAQDVEKALTDFVSSYVDYLAGHPTYVLLLQRAAVDDDPEFGERDASASAIAAGLGAVEELIRSAGSKNLDARQFVVSVIALCFFPFAHEGTLLRPLGFDAHDPEFLRQRKAHVVALLLPALSRR
jgi:AcrR family transcriptional regulator